MHLTYTRTCRICGSSTLSKVINLGPQHLQGSFIKPDKEMPPMRRIATELLRCDPMRTEHACGLLQTSVTVPPQILYSSYWYRSGINPQERLPFLATYLGHRDINSTLVYITVTQDLLHLANERFRAVGVPCLNLGREVQP